MYVMVHGIFLDFFRAVRILLHCILVIYSLHRQKPATFVQIYLRVQIALHDNLLLMPLLIQCMYYDTQQVHPPPPPPSQECPFNQVYLDLLF